MKLDIVYVYNKIQCICICNNRYIEYYKDWKDRSYIENIHIFANILLHYTCDKLAVNNFQIHCNSTLIYFSFLFYCKQVIDQNNMILYLLMI